MCNQHLLWPEDVNALKRRGGLSCQDFWNREDFQEVSEDSDFCAGEEDSGESQDTDFSAASEASEQVEAPERPAAKKRTG